MKASLPSRKNKLRYYLFFNIRAKILILYFLCAFLSGCHNSKKDYTKDRDQITSMLDLFHAAAASADFTGYFKHLADDAVFIGTDATEIWNKKEFMIWAKPYFERGKAWDFKSVDRHIYFNSSGNVAWFDELLDTRMKLCRGSGILIKDNGEWKINQYILSMTIPNSRADSVIRLKGVIEDSLINGLKTK